MNYTILSYVFYLVAVLAGYSAGYQLLVEMFPNFGFIEIAIGLVGGAMFFPLIPLYPGIANDQWIFAIICYISIFFGVILGNKARKASAN